MILSMLLSIPSNSTLHWRNYPSQHWRIAASIWVKLGFFAMHQSSPLSCWDQSHQHTRTVHIPCLSWWGSVCSEASLLSSHHWKWHPTGQRLNVALIECLRKCPGYPETAKEGETKTNGYYYQGMRKTRARWHGEERGQETSFTAWEQKENSYTYIELRRCRMAAWQKGKSSSIMRGRTH